MEIRPAAAADYPTFATLFAELGIPDPVPTSERFAAEIAPHALVGERDGGVIGYVYFKKLELEGYVFNVVVAPAARGAGAGEALMRAAAARLRLDGAAVWHLNVKAENAPAIRLYERLGMARAYRTSAVWLGWDQALSLPAGAGDAVEVVPVVPGDDAALERRFHIVAGRLAQMRARSPRVLFQLRERGAAVGVASFNPEYPGAYPFCVARPELAGVLLHAMHPHARPGDRELQLMVEDDAALVALLVARGGDVRMELYHYSGPLPP